MTNPVLAEAIRGAWSESRHRGAVAICDARGRRIWSVGDIERRTFPRSAIKMLQALPLLESGAADDLGLGDAELALACASHGGEPQHVETVSRWLGRLGVEETCLACGAHAPMHAPSAAALARSGVSPGRVHNNCSGKHAGFLSVAGRVGAPWANYAAPDHPSQRLALRAIADLAGLPADDLDLGVDGCAAPAPVMSLERLAVAMARLADPDGLEPGRATAARRLRAAVRARPDMLAGTGRACTEITAVSEPGVTVKVGAEGVYTAVLGGLGLGVALKIDDGATRAAECVLVEVLTALGQLDPSAPAASRFGSARVRNTVGETVGAVRIAPARFSGLRALGPQ